MIYKRRILSSLFLIALCCLIFAGIGANTSVCAAEATTIAPAAQLFELSDNNDYNIEGQQEVTSFAYGKSSLGSFSINGDIDDVATYRGKPAYGVSGNLSFSYTYNGYLQDNSAESWNISSDTATSVAGYILTGSVGQGVVLIQTSTNGSVYENVVNPVTDFFSGKNGRENFYTTDGNTVAQGSFYRIIIAYETRRKTGTTGIWPFKKDVFEYKNSVEIYEFYVCRNDAVISIHDLSVADEILESEGFSAESLRRGETLLDGAVTTKGFSIDKLGTSYLVSVSKDNEESQFVADGATFTANGKYTVTTITKLGKKNAQTVYIFNGGKNKGFSTYFDDYIVHGHRVYRDELCPVYAKDSIAFLKSTGENVPLLTGTLKNTTTGETFSFSTETRAEQNIPLTAGEYIGVFYSGNSDLSSGSYYKYTFNFKILDEYSAPYLNYYNLMNTQNFEDLGAKHYEVAYPMTHGGYIFVCFSLGSYQEAFNYAYDIEGRFIEKAEDGGLYYKSEKNPNLKVKYYDPIELTRVRNIYAKQNVEYNYFNATDKYTYRTLDTVDELEGLNLPESVKVFASVEEKEKLINRQPFINNFTFIQVADFDVTAVSAYCYKNGKTYSIEFGKSISEQLSVSSKYKITETNIYGDIKEYDVCFLLENLTRSEWEISYNGKSETLSLSVYDLNAGVRTVNADSIGIKSIVNDFDTDSIVTIKAPDAYSFEIKCLLSELKNIELYKKGKYEITFIDRLGNSYKLVVNLTGKTRYSSLKANNLCYTAFYNTVFLNQKSSDEEIVVDIEDLKNLIETVVEKDKYTANSYNVYLNRLQEAKNIYNNPEATQKEVNEATKNLKLAIDELVVSANKTELRAELDLYESLDKEKYTSISFQMYTDSYNIAKKIYADDSASSDDVSHAVSDLQNKYSALVFRGDKTRLIDILSRAKKIDCLKYTPKSIEELNSAFNTAYEVYKNKDAIQSSIDQAVLLVNEKIDSLVLQADFDELEEIIQKVKQVNPKLYNRASINYLKSKYDTACKVFNNRNSSQSDIDMILADLQIAYNGLTEIGDIDGLIVLLREIKDLKWFLYSAEGIKELKTRYDSAVELLNNDSASANDVETTTLLLREMKNRLSQRTDKAELYEYLLHCETIDLSDKKASTAELFNEAYLQAYKTLYDVDAGEEIVSKSMAELQIAENELEKAGLAWWVIVLIVLVGMLVAIGVLYLLSDVL